MTEITAPRVRDLVATPVRPPAPRTAQDDLVTEAARPRRQVRRWLRPLLDLLGATVIILGAQLVLLPNAVASPLVLAACWPVLLATTGCYVVRPVAEPMSRSAGRVLRAGGVLGLTCWLFYPDAGGVAAPGTLAPLVAACTAAGLVFHAVRPARRRVRVVVVGSAEHLSHAAVELASVERYDVAATCASTGGPDGPQVHEISEAVNVALEKGADALVVMPGTGFPPASVRRLQWEAAASGIDVYVSAGLLDVTPARASFVQGAGVGLLHVRPAPVSGPRRLVKEVVERAVAALAVVLLLPLMAVLALMIQLDSAGPAVFRQDRVGRHGSRFTMYKFRSMTTDAEAERASLEPGNDVDEVLFKLRQDPRVTRVGAWLRRYSLDELPQLWNVVTGDMSLVGPRPALPDEVAAYDLDPRRRLAVKPGITGLWQVSGRSDLTWAESVRLDVRYVDNWSLALDLDILRRTVRAVLGHRGAY